MMLAQYQKIVDDDPGKYFLDMLEMLLLLLVGKCKKCECHGDGSVYNPDSSKLMTQLFRTNLPFKPTQNYFFSDRIN